MCSSDLSSAVLSGTGTSTTLLQSASSERQSTEVVPTGATATVRVYDGRGRLTGSRSLTGPTSVRIPAHGIAVVTQ